MVRKPRNAAREAEEGIKDYIRTHRLRTGDLLPSESVLCEELGCSRSSLREAVRTLSSLDVVEVRHGHGTFVSDMSLAPLLRGLILRITLDLENSLENLIHVIDTRQALDLSVAEELAAAYRGKSMDHLHLLVQGMRDQHQAGRSFATEDRRFHATLLSPLENPLVKELSEAFWQVHMQVLPQLKLSMPEDIELTIEAHADMLDALAADDPEAYREVVLRHYAPLRRLLGMGQRDKSA
ncbi:FadR family transcriptional regulator [Corynebacterium testudinoris]|uniref:Transcriptional regulator n=1 Tax=Corynebacterium testudinoris TaxID=136857 RepID=A0A0G3HF01_9CORY|nr:FCD domain-containing protein [Corynebacterium testudinoris]AKK09702.1 transcriptional regulator [Corynebacterium testudinoris]MBX8996293.1 FadR family transcriptional regulator [Corynebacterium testudinoris]